MKQWRACEGTSCARLRMRFRDWLQLSQGSLRVWPVLRQLLNFVRQSILLLVEKKSLQAFDALIALGHMLPLQPRHAYHAGLNQPTEAATPHVIVKL
jgi:hypothetical protein